MAGVELTAAGADTGPRSRLLPGARRTDAAEIVRGTRAVEHSRLWSWLVLGATLVAGVAGAVLMGLAVRLAANGHAGAGALTWIGLGMAVLPAVAVGCARDATGAARWTALLTAAVTTVVPVGLRSGSGPTTTTDLLEYVHLAALRRGGPLFPTHLPTVVADQPGTAALATAVWRVSGLTVWHSALVVVVLAHLVAVFGVRALVRGLGLGERIAVLAAVLWSVGPAVLVATSRVDGTTVGTALLLWALAAVVQAATAAAAGRRLAWSGTAVVLAAGTAVSDLASAWLLVGLTLLVGVATVGVTGPPVSGAGVRRAWWPVATGVLVVTAGWSLTPAGRRVLGDPGALGAAHHRAWSTGPAQASLAGVAALVALALAAAGVFRLRSRLVETGARLGLIVGGLFVVSVLGLLTTPTSTLAVVLWPALAAALAPFVAAGLLVVWDLGARRTRGAAPSRSLFGAVRHAQRDTRAAPVARADASRAASAPVPDRAPDASGVRDRRLPLPVAVAAALVAAAVVGFGAAATTAPSAADPVGPPAAGSVPTADLLAAATRLTAVAGSGFRFVASDRGVGDLLAAVSGGVEVTDGPATTVFGTAPTTATAVTLHDAGVGWLVDATPGGDDALALAPFLVRVVSSPSLTVYRVRPAVPGATGDDTPAADGVVPAASS